jgi:Phage integrase family
MHELLLDRAGRRRSPATMPGFHTGRSLANKGLQYPADPPKVEEIIAVMRAAGDNPHGMDAWGWDELQPWLDVRLELPVGPLLCVINGQTRGRHWSSTAARADLSRTAVRAGVRRRFAPHQLRHAHGVELAREGVPLIVIQRQLGHSNLGITSI